MMRTYEEMLKEAEKKLPRNVTRKERLEVPKPKTVVQGNRTFFINFEEIAGILRRDTKHLSKFLFRELAMPGHIEGGRLILQGRVSSSLLEKKINAYIKEFVLCKECHRPDTRLEKEERVTFMVCDACGAKQPVRKI